MWEPGKPSQNENEYFARRDAEWLKERRAQLDTERAAAAQRLRCPRDGSDLEERVFRHVRIDVCKQCHGVWLDTGELEMVLHLPRAELLRAVGDVGSGKPAR
jgi:ribosomal protein L31